VEGPGRYQDGHPQVSQRSLLAGAGAGEALVHDEVPRLGISLEASVVARPVPDLDSAAPRISGVDGESRDDNVLDGLDLEDVAGPLAARVECSEQRPAVGAAVIGAAVGGARDDRFTRLADAVAAAPRLQNAGGALLAERDARL